MPNTRYFHLHHTQGFTPAQLAALHQGAADWLNWVESKVATWSEQPTLHALPLPHYEVGEPTLSPDHTLLSIPIRGDPGSYGALKLFEDGVPAFLWAYLSSDFVAGLLAAYQNDDLGIPFGQWHPCAS